MKHIIVLILAVLFVGCDSEKQARTACKEYMQPELCKVIVGCGDLPNMQVCEMQTRQMCLGPIEKSTSDDIMACALALRKVSCEDPLPKECWDLD